MISIWIYKEILLEFIKKIREHRIPFIFQYKEQVERYKNNFGGNENGKDFNPKDS